MDYETVNSYSNFHTYKLVLPSHLLAVVVNMEHNYC